MGTKEEVHAALDLSMEEKVYFRWQSVSWMSIKTFSTETKAVAHGDVESANILLRHSSY